MIFNSNSPVLVKTPSGSVRGGVLKGTEKDLSAFYGIPYANAPVGDLRWKDAQDISPWNTVLDCTAPLTAQKSAHQWGSNLLAYFRTLNVSEDCLYLNVTTPDIQGTLPVMVWFHGGGLFGGSGSEEVYNLPYLPEKGCVLVTVTTRLGALGLLTADVLEHQAGAPDGGNYIISDMLSALRWVQKNIASFGGDPGNVTIAGESGGSCKVNALMTVPMAEGLFHRAIMQSGTAGAMPYEDARKIGNLLMEKLGVTTAEEARALPAEAIVEAYNEMNLMADFIVDDYYLAAPPAVAAAEGNYHKIPVIMGVNTGEIHNLLQMIGGIPNYIKILSRIAADKLDAYVYALDQVPATWRPLGFQCVHSLDIAYLFGEWEDTHRYYDGGPWEQQFMFHGAGERMNPADFISPTMDQYDRELSNTIMELWLAFMNDGLQDSTTPAWTPWDPEAENYLLLSRGENMVPSMQAGFSNLSQ